MGVRPYQNQCLQNILDRRAAGVRKQLVSMATGLGKTVTFANLPEHMEQGKQEIVLAHREELVDQAAEKIARWNPHLSIAVDMAGRKADGREDVIVASVQTLSASKGKRLAKYDPARCAWLVPDEAHHSPAQSYRTVFDRFMVNPEATLVGFTATPNRADGIAMGSVFDEIVFHYGMLEGIQDGWLSDVHGFFLKTHADISEVGSSKGDFNDKELTKAINTPFRNEGIVRGWIHYLWPRQTVVFTKDVQHAIDLAQAFQRQNLTAAAVWGDDPDRHRKLEAFRRGDLMILINCQLLIEGFDMWQVEAIIPATPTKSQSKLIQMVGRGTRLQEGIDNLVEWRKRGLLTDEHKQNCVVMDPIDILGRHSLATLPSLFGLPPNMDLQGSSVVAALKAVQKAQSRFPNADLSRLEQLDELDAVAQRVDLWQMRFAEETKGFSGLQWMKRGGNSYRLFMPKGDHFRIEQDIVGKTSVEGMLKGKSYRQEKLPSLADAVRLVESTITQHAPDMLTLLGREQDWLKRPISQNQMQLLQRLNIPDAQIVRMSRGQAHQYLANRFDKNN